MLTVREVGREDQAAATAVGENHQHSSKEPGYGKKQSSSRPDQDKRDVTPWINYHFHLATFISSFIIISPLPPTTPSDFQVRQNIETYALI